MTRKFGCPSSSNSWKEISKQPQLFENNLRNFFQALKILSIPLKKGCLSALMIGHFGEVKRGFVRRQQIFYTDLEFENRRCSYISSKVAKRRFLWQN